jgi:flagellar motor switch protein FliG
VKALAARHGSADPMTGRQKAAIVLMAMGPTAAAEITKGFSADEIEEITYEIARLDRVPSEIVNAVLSEWGQMETAVHSIAEGGVDYARQVLETAVGGQKAGSILKRIEAQLRESAAFRNLRNADPVQMSALLRSEHPQTIALLLAHLDPEQTAELLKNLPTQLGGDVLLRMARLDKVLPEVLQVLEKCYGSESTVTITNEMATAGGPQAVATVLNQMTASFEKELMEVIATADAALSDEIKNLMFVFEDIIKLDDRSMQRVLRDIQMKELALALKAASDPLKQRIIGLMSQRAADTLREEIGFLGPVRLRDVEAAQTAVVRMIRALEAAGEIVVGGSDDDMVL